MKITGIGLEPSHLGFDFAEWRSLQLETIERIINSDAKVVILRWPTGGGKSAVALAVQRILGKSALVLTKTKILQEQYEEQNVSGLYGRDNYICNRFPIVSAAYGVCHLGQSCRLRNGGCDYYDQKRTAVNSKTAVLNYSYFFLEANGPGEFSGRRIIILDEAHSVPDELSRSYTIRINHTDCRKLSIAIPKAKDRLDFKLWREWASNAAAKLIQISKSATGDRVRLISNVRDAAIKIIAIQDPSNWVVQTDNFHTAVKPIWVDKLAKDYLWRHGEKFILMSATINPNQVLQELGLDNSQVEVIDVPSSFPAERRPIYLYPFHKPSHRATESETKALIADLDRILDKYPGRVLVHSGNYSIASYVASNSRHKKRIISHTRETRSARIAEFRSERKRSAVFVSPSMTEGIDLPYEMCSAQVILKCPFPSRIDPVWEARLKDKPKGDRAYIVSTINSIVQACGRGMRAPDDNCETWILDANIVWLYNRNTIDFPPFFKEAVRVKSQI